MYDSVHIYRTLLLAFVVLGIFVHFRQSFYIIDCDLLVLFLVLLLLIDY